MYQLLCLFLCLYICVKLPIFLDVISLMQNVFIWGHFTVNISWNLLLYLFPPKSDLCILIYPRKWWIWFSNPECQFSTQIQVSPMWYKKKKRSTNEEKVRELTYTVRLPPSHRLNSMKLTNSPWYLGRISVCHVPLGAKTSDHLDS